MNEDYKMFMYMVLLPIVALFFIAYFIGSTSCSQYGVVTGKPSQYYFLTGCYVKHGDDWVNVNQLRNTDDINN